MSSVCYSLLSIPTENYNKIVGKLFNYILIKFTANYIIVDILARLKIVCLEKSKDEARKKYRSHKNDYVNHCLGRPMDKLSASYNYVLPREITYYTILYNLGFFRGHRKFESKWNQGRRSWFSIRVF